MEKIERCIKCQKLISEKELENSRGYKIDFGDLDIHTKNQVLIESLGLHKEPKKEFIICEECVERLNRQDGESNILD